MPFFKKGQAALRGELKPASYYQMEIHPDAESLSRDADALARAYGRSSMGALFRSKVVTLCALAATIGGFLFGFDQGLISITLVMDTFLKQFPEVDSEVTSNAGFLKGLMTAMLELGALIGAVQSGFLADRISRKYTIFVGVVWFVIGSVLQTASFPFAMLVVGRTIGGIGIGILSSTAPMYISEIAPPNLRGSLLVCEQLLIVFGICVAYFVTYGTRYMDNEWAFRLPFLLQMVPGFFLAGIIYYLPFSPRWLASVGHDIDCLDSICRLRGLPRDDPKVQAEWLMIRAEACRTREALLDRHPTLMGDELGTQFKLEIAAWVDCFRPGVIRRTLIGILLMFFQQFCGINALIYYGPTLFETLGLEYDLRLTLSGVMNLLQLVAVIPMVYLLDRFGRRPWLLFSSVGMTISHSIVAIMIGLYSYDWKANEGPAWVGVAFIFTFMISYGVGFGPIPWAMPAEIHALSFRAKGVALATCSNWFNNFIIGLITPPLIEATNYGTFIFFAAFSLLSFIWAFFFVPESNKMSLEHMDKLFSSNTARKDNEATQEILDIILKDSTVETGALKEGEIITKSA